MPTIEDIEKRIDRLEQKQDAYEQKVDAKFDQINDKITRIYQMALMGSGGFIALLITNAITITLFLLHK